MKNLFTPFHIGQAIIGNGKWEKFKNELLKLLKESKINDELKMVANFYLTQTRLQTIST